MASNLLPFEIPRSFSPSHSDSRGAGPVIPKLEDALGEVHPRRLKKTFSHEIQYVAFLVNSI